MDRNPNLYTAIENALIKPLIEEVNALEPSEHEFSALYRKNIKRIIKEQKNWNELTYAQKRAGSKKKIRMIILIAAAMIALGGITVAACEPLREWIVSLFVEEYEDHIDVKTFSGSEADFEVPEISGYYIPEYIPDGFTLKEEDYTGCGVWMYWETIDGKNFDYSQNPLDSSCLIDNERHTNENITVNGDNAVLSYNEKTCSIFWNNQKYTFLISGNLSKEEIIKIAESVKLHKRTF